MIRNILLFIWLIISIRILAQNPDQTYLMPDLAGTFRLGIVTESDSYWFADMNVVETKTEKGMKYKITDKRIKDARIDMEVNYLKDTKGSTIKIETKEIPDGTSLIWAYGGASAEEIDIDTNKNNLLPERCVDNVFSQEGSQFVLYYGTSRRLKVLCGVVPATSEMRLADARQQTTPKALFESGKKTDTPLLCAKCPINNDNPLYFVFYKQSPKADYNIFMLKDLHQNGTFIINKELQWMESTPN